MEFQSELQLGNGEHVAVKRPAAALECDGTVFPPVPKRGRSFGLAVKEPLIPLIAAALHLGDVRLQFRLQQRLAIQPVVAFEQGDAMVVYPCRHAQQSADPFLMIAVL